MGIGDWGLGIGDWRLGMAAPSGGASEEHDVESNMMPLNSVAMAESSGLKIFTRRKR